MKNSLDLSQRVRRLSKLVGRRAEREEASKLDPKREREIKPYRTRRRRNPVHKISHLLKANRPSHEAEEEKAEVALLLLQEQVEVDKSLTPSDDYIHVFEAQIRFTYIALYIYHFIIKFMFFQTKRLPILTCSFFVSGFPSLARLS